MMKSPKSPLEGLKNLQQVSPEKVAALEQKLRAGYMKAIERQVRSDRLSAENLRAKVLY